MNTTISALHWTITFILISVVLWYRAEVYKFSFDAAFNCMNRMAAEAKYKALRGFSHVIFIDIANMHGLNHAYSMAEADEFIRNVVAQLRTRDIVVRWGGDELVILSQTNDIESLTNKIGDILHANNLYGVIVATEADNLAQSVKKCDAECMSIKKHLEETGKKPGRNEAYKVLDNVIAYA